MFGRSTVVGALAALLLTLMVLTFVERNPWMLFGVAAILLAIAAVVRAIKGTPAPEPPPVQQAEQLGELRPPNADSTPPAEPSS
jgi:hypothetical protein